MTANLRSLLYTLAKLLTFPWLLVTHQPPAAGPARQQDNLGSAEEDVELGLYLLR